VRATQSWVYRENRRGLRRTLVMTISVEEVMLHKFTTLGRPVRKSRTQLHREELSPRAVSSEGAMELKAELNSNGTYSSPCDHNSLEAWIMIGQTSLVQT
jgi:hypothetical protein